MKIAETFTAAQRAVIAELHERDRAERDAGIREPMSLMALSPAVAELLCLLVRQRHARKIAEFGTSHGYSTVHLAAAAAHTGGHVYSVELLPEKSALAAASLEAAGLRERVTLVSGDGADFAASLPAAVDFVLVDYGVAAFAPAFEPLRSRLAPGCLLFFDGGGEGYWDAGAVGAFRERLEARPDFLVLRHPMRQREQLIALHLGEPGLD